MKDPRDLQERFSLATVGVGSNVGDRASLIENAVRQLGEQEGNRISAISSLYETEPFGKGDQPWFLNCVVQVETQKTIKAFFHSLQTLETSLGRLREERWGTRTLDLDLLFFNNTVFSDQELTVPHPGIPHRRFVLEPLCEIAPALVHPIHHLTAHELYKQLSDPLNVICLGRSPVS